MNGNQPTPRKYIWLPLVLLLGLGVYFWLTSTHNDGGNFLPTTTDTVNQTTTPVTDASPSASVTPSVTVTSSALPTFTSVVTPTIKPTSTPTPAPTPTTVAMMTVVIQDFAFKPATITVSKGIPIKFINKDTVAHSVTADNEEFDSGLFGLDQEYILNTSALSTGIHPYHYAPHPSMKGTINVI